MLGAATAGEPPNSPLLCSSPELFPSYLNSHPPTSMPHLPDIQRAFLEASSPSHKLERPRNMFGIGVGTRWAQVKGGTILRNRERDKPMEGREGGAGEGGREEKGMGWGVGARIDPLPDADPSQCSPVYLAQNAS